MLMVWQAIGLHLNDPKGNFLMVAVAAVLFAFSDSIIAYDKFITALNWAGILILSTYWLAIYLLARSVGK
jgi:uncharacterized membrane protein YhhN